jgi:hypothetical protein
MQDNANGIEGYRYVQLMHLNSEIWVACAVKRNTTRLVNAQHILLT